MPRNVLSTILVVLALQACQCEDKTPVPFKRGESVPAKPTAPGADAATALKPEELPPNAVVASYAEGTVRVVVEGATAERSEGSFRASLAADLDGDAVRDAVFVGSDAQGRPRVETALRKGESLALGGALRLFAEDLDCKTSDARLSPLGDALAVATLSVACAPKAAAATPAAAPAAGTPAPPSAAPVATAVPKPRVHRYLLTLEPSPRVLLHVSLREAPAPALPLGVALSSEDRDADDHADVRLDLDVAVQAGPPRKLSLLWFDRPSGLARDGTEPEQTLGALAAEASGHLPKSPDQALLAAETALDLHARLCRESGRAELEVDDEAGVPCGASTAAGRAAVIRVVSLSRKRQLLPALEAFAALASPAYRVDEAQRQRALRALATIPGDTEYVWREGPAFSAPDAPAVRLPALGFVDEAQLLLRGPVARSYDLGTQAVAPVALAGSVLAQDPATKAAIVDVVRSCDGRRLRVAKVAEGIEGLSAGASLGPSAIGARLEPSAVSVPACAAGSDGKSDRAGLSVLGYTEKGLLVARGATLLLAATPGEVGSEARELTPDEPVPGLVSPGALSGDGLRYVLATSEGVAVVTRGSTTSVRLVRTPASCTTPPSDAAISPSGQRVAMLCGGKIYVAERAAPPAPPAAAAPGSPALPSGAAPAPAPAPSAPLPVTALPPPAPEPPASPTPPTP